MVSYTHTHTHHTTSQGPVTLDSISQCKGPSTAPLLVAIKHKLHTNGHVYHYHTPGHGPASNDKVRYSIPIQGGRQPVSHSSAPKRVMNLLCMLLFLATVASQAHRTESSRHLPFWAVTNHKDVQNRTRVSRQLLRESAISTRHSRRTLALETTFSTRSTYCSLGALFNLRFLFCLGPTLFLC